MGKSSSGKDTIYKKLLKDEILKLKRIIPYTTRPLREGEQNGVEYYFSDEAELSRLQEAGQVVEVRAYHTVHGIWKYFTVWDETMDLDRWNYAVIGTLEAWHAMCAYFGREHMIPVYIEVEDGLRLSRALERERVQPVPRYAELCRRFLADLEDFSDEKLKKEGIDRRFQNDDVDRCLEEIKFFIQKEIGVWYNN